MRSCSNAALIAAGLHACCSPVTYLTLLYLPFTGGGECTDLFDGCAKWGQEGECQKNPLYMKGICCATCKNAGSGNKQGNNNQGNNNQGGRRNNNNNRGRESPAFVFFRSSRLVKK